MRAVPVPMANGSAVHTDEHPVPAPRPPMKPDIHPKYFDCQVTCGCGNKFQTRATVKELHIEICGVCHPFYSGKQKFVDTAGRVDRFVKKYGASAVAKKK
jgi:large subunit ribosomal protein L31